MVALTFNARTVAPAAPGGVVLPTAWYAGAIVESGFKPVKDKPNSAYLMLELQVKEGPHAGAKVFHRLNLYNDSQQAVDIAAGELSAICHATGVIDLQDTAQLHNVPLMFRVVEKPAEGQYAVSNEVKGFKAYEASASQHQAAAPAGNAWQPPAAAPAAAWAPPAGGGAPAAAPTAAAPWNQPAGAPAAGQQQQAASAPWNATAPAAPAGNTGTGAPPWAAPAGQPAAGQQPAAASSAPPWATR